MQSDRILCPFHIERTPSCVIYENRFKCFGCGKTGHISELNLDLSRIKTKKRIINRSVNQEIKYIMSLPTQKIRGLDLHYDNVFYYILWPDLQYYKKRKFIPDESKYICPWGTSKPLFTMPGSYKDLLIVEGELNALSIYEHLKPDYKIVSPGPCTDFLRYLDYYLQYDYIYVAFDFDKAGVQNYIKLRDVLQQHGKLVFPHPMQRDFNDILVMDGLDETRREVEKIRGLQTNMQDSKRGQDMQLPGSGPTT